MHGQLGVLNEACLDVVSASDNPQQARVGCRVVIRILDKHSQFATDALEPCRRHQCHEIIGVTVQPLILQSSDRSVAHQATHQDGVGR